jgi:hypothetical protein
VGMGNRLALGTRGKERVSGGAAFLCNEARVYLRDREEADGTELC